MTTGSAVMPIWCIWTCDHSRMIASLIVWHICYSGTASSRPHMARLPNPSFSHPNKASLQNYFFPTHIRHGFQNTPFSLSYRAWSLELTAFPTHMWHSGRNAPSFPTHIWHFYWNSSFPSLYRTWFLKLSPLSCQYIQACLLKLAVMPHLHVVWFPKMLPYPSQICP